MVRGKPARTPIYIPPLLKEALKGAADYPLTLVEAGSGFGKTTAVAEALGDPFFRSFETHWHTFFGEPPENAWEALASLLGKADPDAARYLKKLLLPTAATIAEISAVMDGFRCKGRKILVLDNYQLAGFEISARLLDALSSHRCRGLHIIALTQPLRREAATVTNPKIHRIDGNLLTFGREDVKNLFSLSGVLLSEAQLDELMKTSEGWISALRLQMAAYSERGEFESARDISQLMETALWNKLDEKERDMLLRLSLFDKFSARQGALMLGKERLSEDEELLLRDDPFVRRDAAEERYVFHSLMRAYLARKFAQQPEAFRRGAVRQAAAACAAVGELFAAALFCARAGDYEALFSLPLAAKDITELVGFADGALIEKLLTDCPREILTARPERITQISLYVLLRGNNRLFGRCLRLLDEISASELYGETRQRKIRGEIEFIKFFLVFNDLPAMTEAHEKAYALLGGAAGIFPLTGTWTFGASSVVCLFWRRSGRLASALEELKRGLPRYHRLTDGHGTGAASAMEAEMLLLSGDAERAEAESYRTLYLSEAKNQDSVSLCAELTLARAAILRADAAAFSAAAEKIRRIGVEGQEHSNLTAAGLCLAFLFSAVGLKEKIPQWCRDVRAIDERVYEAARPFAHITYAGWLLDNDPVKFRGLISELTKNAESRNMMLPLIYFLIYRAVDKKREGKPREAAALLKEALEAALPDKVLLPFAELGEETGELLERLNVAGRAEILKLSALMAAGRRKIQEELLPRTTRLTKREGQVAALLADGLSARESAERLGISEGTVRVIRKSVYKKLSVRSKGELIKKLS
ncbi:MAG: LuxR C-terminal-related transcriptional regulator [Synergistaceae bacterium]|nr:LuxR C-terminal-related transcriptional regulator [Synergistaceae bacterium]